MGKALSILAMLIAIGLLVLFGLDLSPLKIPFRRASMTIDIAFIICALLLAVLSFRSLREQR